MNRILSFLLALVFAFSLGTEVLAATESGGRENEETDCLDSFSFNVSYNEDVSAGIAGESKMQTLMLTDMRRPMNMTLNFESIDGDYYRAYGTISLPNGNKSYSAEGNVNQYVLKSGLSGYIGNLRKTLLSLPGNRNFDTAKGSALAGTGLVRRLSNTYSYW